MARQPKLDVEVVTGERVVYRAEDVDLVSVPGADGQLGILPRHAALFSLLSAGELFVRKGNEEESLAVFGGFLQVQNNHVLVLADSAERVEEIDLDRAEAARQRAEQALQQRGEDVDVEQALRSLRRARVRTNLVSRRRRGRAPSTSPGQQTGGPGR